MSFEFNYFVAHGLLLAATGPTDETYIGNGGVDYGLYDEPANIFSGAMIARIANQTYSTIADTTPKAIIDIDNNLYTWGLNTYGELGHGDTNPLTEPTLVSSMAGVADKVYVSAKNVYVIKTDGTLWGAGEGDLLGTGVVTPADESSFIQIVTGTWDFLSAHTAGCMAVNTVGDAYYFDTDAPVYVRSAVSRVAGAGNSGNPIWLLLTTGKDLYGYSSVNSYSEIIPGQDGVTCDPAVVISGTSDWSGVYASPYHNCCFAIKENGGLYYWGTPPHKGYLGLGAENTLLGVSSPTLHPSGGTFKDLSLSATYVTAYLGFNQIVTWGLNVSGCMGIGDLYIDTYAYSPTYISSNETPYYAIPNMDSDAISLLDVVTVDETSITLPYFTVSGFGEAKLFDASVSLKRLNVSGSIITNFGADFELPSLEIDGALIAGRLLNDAGNMKISLEAYGTILTGKSYDGTVQLPRFQVAGDFTLGSAGEASISLPKVTMSGEFYSLAHNAAIELASITCYGVIAGLASESFGVLAMNKKTTAFSIHDTGLFNCCGKLGDVQIVGTDNGLYSVSGNDDDGVAIDASVGFAMSDLGIMSYKHLRTMYLDVTTDKQIVVTVTFDTGDTYTRTLGASTQEALIQNLKFVGKRDKAGRSIKVDLANVGGGEFTINGIDVYTVNRTRGHGKD